MSARGQLTGPGRSPDGRRIDQRLELEAARLLDDEQTGFRERLQGRIEPAVAATRDAQFDFRRLEAVLAQPQRVGALVQSDRFRERRHTAPDAVDDDADVSVVGADVQQADSQLSGANFGCDCVRFGGLQGREFLQQR